MAATPLFGPVTITGTGPTAGFTLADGQDCGIFLAGGTATVVLEASPDNGATWFACVAAGSNAIYSWSLTGSNQFDSFQSPLNGLQLRFNCTAFTSNVTVSAYK